MLTIMAETPDDLPEIYRFYSEVLGQAQEADLVKALRETSYTVSELSLIAKKENQIVGHILFTRTAIKENRRTNPAFTITHLVALQDDHFAICSALIEKGLKIARYLGYSSILAYGHSSYYLEKDFYPLAHDKLVLPSFCLGKDFLVKHMDDTKQKNHGIVSFPTMLHDFFIKSFS